MKRLLVGGGALAVLLALALAPPSAQAAPFGPKYGKLTLHERAAIAHSRARLNMLKRRAWADGRVTWRERVRINVAQARHNALVRRYHYN